MDLVPHVDVDTDINDIGNIDIGNFGNVDHAGVGIDIDIDIDIDISVDTVTRTLRDESERSDCVVGVRGRPVAAFDLSPPTLPTTTRPDTRVDDDPRVVDPRVATIRRPVSRTLRRRFIADRGSTTDRNVDLAFDDTGNACFRTLHDA